jgi:hypothetical protein
MATKSPSRTAAAQGREEIGERYPGDRAMSANTNPRPATGQTKTEVIRLRHGLEALLILRPPPPPVIQAPWAQPQPHNPYATKGY